VALNEALPYGLRDVKVSTLTSAGVKGTSVDLPNSRTFSFEESEDFEELRGDDKVVTTRGKGAAVAWDLEAGGISLEALVVINGGTLTVTGTTPAVVKKYQKKATDQRPEFFVEGQAMSESGGDFHAVLYRCKATGGVSGELADGAFFLTAASGDAYPSKSATATDAIYDLIANETAVAIT
jgi:hypothetical protein